MAGILKVDDLRGNTSAGDITITSEGGSATMQLQQGVAKCWVNFNGTGTVATRDSLNQSSLVDDGTATYTVNVSNNLGNANYSVVFGSGLTGDDYISMIDADGTPSASSFQISGRRVGSVIDGEWICPLVHGDLA